MGVAVSIPNNKSCYHTFDATKGFHKTTIPITFNYFNGLVQFNDENLLMSNTNIMTINDYVKLMVLSYQSKYPDTELSKKLGISRKSLWEKRKKLGIEKKK